MTTYRMDPARPGLEMDLALASERIAGLQRVADHERLATRLAARRAGGLRGRVGTALIALGSALAAPEPSFVSGPARRP